MTVYRNHTVFLSNDIKIKQFNASLYWEANLLTFLSAIALATAEGTSERCA